MAISCTRIFFAIVIGYTEPTLTVASLAKNRHHRPFILPIPVQKNKQTQKLSLSVVMKPKEHSTKKKIIKYKTHNNFLMMSVYL